MTENRQFSRILFDTPAFIRQSDNQWLVKVVDLSLKGVLIARADTEEGIRSQNSRPDIQGAFGF